MVGEPKLPFPVAGHSYLSEKNVTTTLLASTASCETCGCTGIWDGDIDTENGPKAVEQDCPDCNTQHSCSPSDEQRNTKVTND